MKWLLPFLFAVRCLAFSANDGAKTISTDGSQLDTTNAFAYVIGKGEPGWVCTVGSANGAYNWTNLSLTITQQFTVRGAGTISTRPTITFDGGAAAGFTLRASSNQVVTVSNFILTSTAAGPVGEDILILGQGVCFRLAYILTTNKLDAGATILYVGNTSGSDGDDNHPGPYGLIDHWTNMPSASGLSQNGLYVVHNGGNNHYGWSLPNTWGGTNCVVIEDSCDWTSTGNGRAGQPFVDGYAGARVTIRNCAITNNDITFHPYYSGGGQDGFMQLELYSNYFYYDEVANGFPWALWLRAGSVYCWSNTVAVSQNSLLGTAWRLTVECASSQWVDEHCPAFTGSYPGDYPNLNQIGQGVNGSGQAVTNGCYFWSNTVPAQLSGNTTNWPYSEFTIGIDTDSPFIRTNRDWSANIQAPGYTALAYPHPLASGSSGGGSSATNAFVLNGLLTIKGATLQ